MNKQQGFTLIELMVISESRIECYSGFTEVQVQGERKMANIKTAYCYCRVSQKVQATEAGGYGMTRQQNLLLNYVRNYEPKPNGNASDDMTYELSVDQMEYLNAEGVSGFSGKNIEEGSVLLTFINKVIEGKIKNAVLVIENLDRFSRANPQRAAAILIRLLQADCHIHEVDMETIHTENTTLLDIATGLERAHKESLRKQRLSTKNWDKRFNNMITDRVALTGRCPAWLTVVDGQYIVNEYHAEQIRHIFKLYNGGYGQAYIRNSLNESGMLYNEKTWGDWLVHRILNDRRVTGVYIAKSALRTEYDGIKAYPEIISDTDFAAAQQRLKAPGRDKKINKNANNLFSGLTICGFCKKAHLTVTTDSKNKACRYFNCTSKSYGNGRCISRGFKYDIVENAILQRIQNAEFEYYDDSKKHSELESLQTDLITKIHYRDEVIAEMEKSDIPDPYYLKTYKNLKARIAELELKIQSLEQVDDIRGEVDIIRKDINDELLERTNVKMRQSFNEKIRRIIKSINIVRVNTCIMIKIEYYKGVKLQSIIIDDKTGELINHILIDDTDIIHEASDGTITNAVDGTPYTK